MSLTSIPVTLAAQPVVFINIKRLSSKAVIPKYAKHGDAGLDLVATSCEYIEELGVFEYGTSLAVEIPFGHVGLIFPRSSISKTGLALSNAVGVVDSEFRGEIKLRFKRTAGSWVYKVGDRVGQLIVMPYPKVEFTEVEELSKTERGSGGFGHTGE